MSTSNLVAEAVWTEVESTHSVTDDQLAMSVFPPIQFHFMFGKNFERATKLVDRGCVKRISGQPSGRCIYQVMGESQRKEEYFCFPESYCGCHSFFYETVNRGEQLCCKHQLAARLAASLETCVQVQVPDEELAVLLSNL